MAFRTATLSDIDPLLALQREFYEQEGYPFDVAGKRRAMAELLANPSYGRIVAFEVDGAVAGYLVVAFGFSLEFGGRDAFVDELFVLPSARGRGLGTQALELAEQLCRENSIHALHLEVEFVNESAKRLYARRGYAEHTRQLMTKRL
jgi:GNAT superfamily N-acetyltransferase